MFHWTLAIRRLKSGSTPIRHRSSRTRSFWTSSTLAHLRLLIVLKRRRNFGLTRTWKKALLVRRRLEHSRNTGRVGDDTRHSETCLLLHHLSLGGLVRARVAALTAKVAAMTRPSAGGEPRRKPHSSQNRERPRQTPRCLISSRDSTLSPVMDHCLTARWWQRPQNPLVLSRRQEESNKMLQIGSSDSMRY